MRHSFDHPRRWLYRHMLCLFVSAAVLFSSTVSAESVWENLVKSTENASFTLDAPLSAVTPNGKVAFGVRAGQYSADRENSLGIFYKGPPHCAVLQVGSRFRAFPGGIWVPKAAGARPQLYVYQGNADEFDSLALGLQADVAKNGVASSSSSTGSSDAANGVLIQTIVNSPVRISPAQGAIAGAIVGGILALAESQQDPEKPMLVPRTEVANEAWLQKLPLSR